MLLTYTACPATFDTLCEGYYSGVGGPTGQFVVYSGRGRLKFFLRYHGSIWVDGKVVKNQVKNWKIAFLAFFVHLVKCPNHHNKVPFFYFFPFMGMREIDTDTIGYHELGILDISQCVRKNRWDTGTSVPVSQLQFLLVDPFLMSQITLLL